ncbi:MAG: dipeptidase [Chloroflexi bacterium]|nr:dipeptidase [Chloroflexota bacterium]
MDARERALAYVQQHEADFLQRLAEFVAIPSVSTKPEYQAEVARAADWLIDQLQRLGAQTARFTEGVHPMVYGHLPADNPDAPTVLLYGHYDVQPAEPLEKWSQPDPFRLEIRGENAYGRGTADMKAQLLALLAAVEAVRHAGPQPVHFKFLFEGEEEIGSPGAARVLAAHPEAFRADFCLNPDAGMQGPDLPSITYALRGLAYFELRVHGPSHDLHSGAYGGAIHNPAQAMAELLAGMHDADGRVTLPGFYDRVRPLTDEERARLAQIPFDEEAFLASAGAPALWGEPEYTVLERITARPTLEINGLYSGFIEEGSKTIIPAYAMAKLSARLVPDQRPEDVAQGLRAHLETHAPPTIRWELEQMASAPPVMVDVDTPAVQALARALAQTWGREPLYTRNGGTIPIVAMLQDQLGIASVLTGFALPDSGMHGPDEHQHLPTWYKGIRALVRYFYELGESGS